MASTSWTGALEFQTPSGPIPVHVALYNRVIPESRDSFKTLAPDGKPVKSVYIDSGEHAKLAKNPHSKVTVTGRNDTRKGIGVGKDEWVALSEDQAEDIASAERSTIVSGEYVSRASIPFDLTAAAMIVVPDKKVAASDRAANQFWNGLRDKGAAFVTQITMKSGSRDRVVAFYAEDDGLYAVTLPYAPQIADVPRFDYTADADAAAAVGAAIADAGVGEYDPEALTSEYVTRRESAIAAALDGKAPVKRTGKPGPETQTGGDLMAGLKAAVDAQSKGKGKSKPAAKKSKVSA